jgi:ATP-dependent RNA helicase DeaD
VATPGRLLDHLRSAAIKPDGIAHVILDEADQMLDMGFKDELDAIVAELPESRSSHMISATFPREVLHLARTFQKDALHIEGTQLGQANADIEHVAHLVRPNELYAAMVNLLLLTQGERCLVFVRRRSDATELATMLTEDGFSVLPFSGELPQAQRTRTLNAFRAGIANTLISTDVAARGIDVPDIAVVIHAEPPTSPDVYTHRSGRTGRAGRQGKSLLLVPTRAQNRIAQLLRAAKVEAKWEPVPTAAKVKKALLKKARAELHNKLAAASEPIDAELAYAQGLLEKHSAQKLVATLLEMAAPQLPREPMEISPIEPKGHPTDSRHRDSRRTDAHRTDPPSGNPHRADAPRATANGRRGESFEQFQTNWGSRQGATPGRLLSHLCRRCGISSQQIGAIDIRDTSSTFGVASSIADQFETKASRPDERDPDVRIFRIKRAGVPPLPHSPRGAQPHREAHTHQQAQTHQQPKPRRSPPHLKHKKRH